MTRGGYRFGAGRPPGVRTGRKKVQFYITEEEKIELRKFLTDFREKKMIEEALHPKPLKIIDLDENGMEIFPDV